MKNKIFYTLIFIFSFLIISHKVFASTYPTDFTGWTVTLFTGTTYNLNANGTFLIGVDPPLPTGATFQFELSDANPQGNACDLTNGSGCWGGGITYIDPNPPVTPPVDLVPLLTDVDNNIILTNQKLDQIYNLFSSGNFVEFTHWILVAIYAGFSLVFFKFIYKFFFGRL